MNISLLLPTISYDGSNVDVRVHTYLYVVKFQKRDLANLDFTAIFLFVHHYMQAAPLRCTSRLLSRGLPSSRYRLHDTSVVAQQGLHTYPIFNLNDVSDRSLGPRPGDEAILTLSGGVDSSVAAYLALEKGGLIPHKTIFMRNWNSLEESEGFEPGSGGSVGCQWKKDWDKVVATAKCLDVEAQLVST